MCASFRYKRFVTHTYCGVLGRSMKCSQIWCGHTCTYRCVLDNDSQVPRTCVSCVCISSPRPVFQVHYRHCRWTSLSSGTWWTRRALWSMHTIRTRVASRTNGAGLVCTASIFLQLPCTCPLHAQLKLSINVSSIFQQMN